LLRDNYLTRGRYGTTFALFTYLLTYLRDCLETTKRFTAGQQKSLRDFSFYVGVTAVMAACSADGDADGHRLMKRRLRGISIR